MAAITLRPREPSDDERLVAIGNLVFPDHPPETVERFRRRINNLARTESSHQEYVVAEEEGVVAGGSALIKAIWLAAPDVWYVDIQVAPDRRGRGIGNALWDDVLRRARQLGAQRVHGEVREDLRESMAFVRRRGFEPTGHGDRLSRLAVATANLEGFDGVEERLAQEGIRVASLAEIGVDDEDWLREVYEMEALTVHDIPSAEEHGDTWPFELWREEMIDAPDRPRSAFFIALHGDQPAGVARLSLREPRSAFNSYTGVHPAYRGRGVARALKRRAILWARENGVDFIYTGNDTENRRMLDINIRLGYQMLPGTVGVVRDLSGAS